MGVHEIFHSKLTNFVYWQLPGLSLRIKDSRLMMMRPP